MHDSDDPVTAATAATPLDTYNRLLAEEASRLDGALASIRADEAAGYLTTREAADNRIQVMEANLTRLRLLRSEYLGDNGGS
jgi:hypothetical protein